MRHIYKRGAVITCICEFCKETSQEIIFTIAGPAHHMSGAYTCQPVNTNIHIKLTLREKDILLIE